MQANQISLNVDVLNDGNTVAQTYDRYEEFQNRSIYVGATHVPEARDQMAIYRTFPSKSGNFKGVSKSAIKFTADVEVPGVDASTTLTAPMIGEVTFSLPVGCAAADVKELRQRIIAALDVDTFMDSLSIQLMV